MGKELTLSKMGYARYEFLPLEDGGTIEAPTNFPIPKDVDAGRSEVFNITYIWEGNNCTIKKLEWYPKLPGEDTAENGTTTEPFENFEGDEFKQNNKITIQIGTGESSTISGNSYHLNRNKNGTTYPKNFITSGLPTISNVGSAYLTASFNYSYIVESEGYKVNYFIKIDNIKIPKVSKYENNVVFTKDGIMELVNELKLWPYVDTINGNVTQGITIPKNANLNNYIIPGRYWVESATVAGTISNTPITTSGYTLHVIGNYSENYTLQFATTANAIYYRLLKSRSNKTWQSWQKVLGDSANYPRATNTYSIGTTNLKWKNLYLSDSIGDTSNLVPNAYITNLGASGTPVTNAYITNLGASGTPVSDAYIQNLTVANLKIGDKSITDTLSDTLKAYQLKHKTLTPSFTFSNSVTAKATGLTGITDSNTIIVSPDPSSWSQWRENGIRCTKQENGSITLTADNAISITTKANIVILDK